MSNIPIRIAVSGATGRMGRQLIQTIIQSKQVILTTALARTGSTFCGIDAGELAGVGTLGIVVNSELAEVKDNFDILIDFTCPDATMNYLAVCRRHHKGMVIGTTGFSDSQRGIISAAAQETGVVFAANFSIGVNLMFKLLEKITKVIGDEADIEIIEAHHRCKVDAPSGTALAMGKIMATVLGYNTTDYAIYSRTGYTGERKAKSIGFATLRAGDIIGEHTVLFAKVGERLEITHKTSSRKSYASGAVRAAIWLSSQKKGLFDMIDVLHLDKL